MKRYRHIGTDPNIGDVTALGQTTSSGVFRVQVDDLDHWMSHGWYPTDPEHWMEIPYCPGCHNEIDPDLCWCGAEIEGHGHWDGHGPVPMGCTCGYVTAEDLA